MALTKESVFNNYIDEISEERERRLLGLNKVDIRAEYLWEEALNTVSIEEKNELITAYDYAKTITYDHPGLSAEIYFTHPLRVASYAILLADEFPVEAGKVGLLHNVFEVSTTSYDDIDQRFGKEVSFIIESLTVDRALQWDVSYKNEYYKSINSLPKYARNIKVIDKFDNLFVLGLNPDPDVRSKYLSEIKQYIVPIIKKDLPYMFSYFSRLIINCEKTGKL